jgi:heptosyltransferase-2
MLGDVLTSTIIADQLKIIYPQAHIDYLIIAHASAIIAQHPAIDGVIKVTKADFEKLPLLISLSRKLKQNNYNLLIDAYGKNNSALLSFLSGIKQRIGYKKWFSGLAYTDAVENKPDFKIDFKGTSLWSRLILTSFLSKKPNWDLQPKIYLTDLEKNEGSTWLIDKGLHLDQPITMISVLGSEERKTWPAEYMAVLLDELVKKTNTQVLFNYIPSQKEQALKVYHLCTAATQKQIWINDYAPSIRDFLKILHHCTCIIGNEGGAINMGKALDVPSFSIFSPWIVKDAWNAGEDNNKHMAVHLQDYEPALYVDKNYRRIKKEYGKYYKLLTPDLLKQKLDLFIGRHF